MTITEFILARYDDIEQVARGASPGPWSPDADGHEVLAEDGVTVAEGFALSGPQLRATVEHIALNDPEWVLADIAAKRQIVEHAERWQNTLRRTPEGWTADTATAYRMAMEWTLRLLAEPFASHPDYDPAWRP